MYKAYYEVSSMYPMYPYYYYVSIVYYGNECTRLIDARTFDVWKDVIDYAKQYNAILVFDGLI